MKYLLHWRSLLQPVSFLWRSFTEFEDHAKIIARSIFIHETENDVIFMSAEKLKISFSHLVFSEVIYDKDGEPSCAVKISLTGG